MMRVRPDLKAFESLFIKISRFVEETAGAEGMSIKHPEQDGIVADPCHHIFLCEDAHIRILSVKVPPDTTENYHTHELPSIMYVDKPCDILLHIKNVKTINICDSNPRVMHIPDEPLHAVTNLDKKNTYEAIRFEMKKISCSQPSDMVKKIENFIKDQRKELDLLREYLSSQLASEEKSVSSKKDFQLCEAKHSHAVPMDGFGTKLRSAPRFWSSYDKPGKEIIVDESLSMTREFVL